MAGGPAFDTVLDCAHEYQRFLNDVKAARQTGSVDPRMKNHEGRPDIPDW